MKTNSKHTLSVSDYLDTLEMWEVTLCPADRVFADYTAYANCRAGDVMVYHDFITAMYANGYNLVVRNDRQFFSPVA